MSFIPAYHNKQSAMTQKQTPDEIFPGDLGEVVNSTTGERMQLLLFPKEYQRLAAFQKRHHPVSKKLSRHDSQLRYSIVFDERGEAFILYRGKSTQERLERLSQEYAGTALSPGAKAALEKIQQRPDLDANHLLAEGEGWRKKWAQSAASGRWYIATIQEQLGCKQYHFKAWERHSAHTLTQALEAGTPDRAQRLGEQYFGSFFNKPKDAFTLKEQRNFKLDQMPAGEQYPWQYFCKLAAQSPLPPENHPYLSAISGQKYAQHQEVGRLLLDRAPRARI